MIIVAVTMVAKPGKRARFFDLASKCVDLSRKEAGNISYGIYASTENDSDLLVYEEWKDQGSIDEHMVTEHYKTLSGYEKAYIQDVSVKRYEVKEDY